MKFSVAVTAALVAGASAHYKNDTVVYTTEVVTAYTTYCPGATQVVHGSKTYTVTEATTLTITDCPCTITKPVFSSSSTPVVTSNAPVVNSVVTSGAPIVTPPTSAPYVNSTIPGVPGTPGTSEAPVATPPIGTGSAPAPPPSTPTGSSAPIATGAASRVFAASGAGLAGALGLAAYLL